MIILAGSKATIADLAFVRDQGWDIDILAHHRKRRPILGICGGYQILGKKISDLDCIEGMLMAVSGLGLLNVETVITPGKTLARVSGEALGEPFEGYEMHLGETKGPDTLRPVARFVDGRLDGATSTDGLVAGSYVHGLFANRKQRRAWMKRIGVDAVGPDHSASVDAALDAIALVLESHLDMEAIIELSK